jgi:tetratricopeptide (TPR) repeat protein
MARPVRTILVAAAFSLSAALAPRADAYADLEARFLKSLETSRSDPKGVVDLYRVRAIQPFVDGTAPLEESLRALLADPRTDPEVAAHGAALLAEILRDTGRDAEAERLVEGLGFLRNWLLLGPFDDDNKSGFDAAYPPESDLRLDATYTGKVHMVTWRPLPVPAPDGVVPLDELLDPVEKAAGYGLAFVKVSADRPCVLRGGFNEAFKIWVDGELVGSAKVYGGRALDQVSVPCTLRRGWNAVLVKVCNQESGWNFSLRLTDAEGRALQGFECTSDVRRVKESIAAMLAKDGAAPPGFSFRDPMRVLEERAASGAAEALKDWGTALYRLRLFDRADPRHLEILRKAAEGDPKDPVTWLTLAEAEEDHNRRREALERGLTASPRHPILLAELGRYYLDRNMPFPALDHLRQAREADPGSPALEALQMRVLLRFASDGAGAFRLQRLAEEHPRCLAVLEGAAEAARRLGSPEESRRWSAAMRALQQGDPGSWADGAEEALERGDVEEGRRLFEEALRRFPVNRQLAFTYASKLLDLRRPREAEGVLGRLLAWCPDWSPAHALLGEVRESLGDREGALAAFRQALLLNPQQEDLKRRVAFLSPKEEPFWGPYRVAPEEVAKSAGRFRGQPAVVLLQSEVVEVQETGLSSRYVQRVVEIRDPQAARDYETIQVGFDPDREEVKVLEASLVKADGSRIHAEVQITDALSDPQVRLYYRNRNMVLSFPAAQAGDVIWVEYLLSDSGAVNDYGQYFGDLVPFGEGLPVLSRQYTLLVSPRLPLFLHGERIPVSPLVVTRGGRKVYRWNLSDLPPLEREPLSPGYTETGAYLHLSTFPDREAMGRWYARFVQDQWEPTPEMREKAAELVRGAADPRERVRAIHRWVVQQTRYVGLEFGVHGYRPYKARQVFARRFGDCKDKALLLAVLLKEAGFDAAMVLVRTRDNGSIAPEPASLAIFNHAICYVPEMDLFLDGTAEYAALGELPALDQGVEVQVVWPDGRTQSRRTPVFDAAANTYTGTYRLEIGREAQDARGSLEIAVTGQECSWIRARYQDPATLREKLEKDLSPSFPGTRLDSASSQGIAELDSPVKLRVEGRFGQAARPEGKARVSLPLWMGRLDLSSSVASLEERDLPLVLDFPWEQTYDVAYLFPEGAAAEAPPEVHEETPFGLLDRTVTPVKGGLRIVTRIRLAVTRVEAEAYPAFRAFCQRADRLAGERLRLRFEGSTP